MNKSRRRSFRTPLKRKRNEDVSTSMLVSAHKRKSLRLQHSISLHMPMEELDNTSCHMNCYVDLARQVFSLTYLEVDNTQNPDSLTSLEVLKKQQWQAFIVGHLFNFDYSERSLLQLSNQLSKTLNSNYQNVKQGLSFESSISVYDDLSPTENDSQALEIEVILSNEAGRSSVVYKAYLLSWCSPTKVKGVFLPILLCRGPSKHQLAVNSFLSEHLDVFINKLVLTQDEMIHLSTYCLIMLSENDNFKVNFIYEIPLGTIKVQMEVPTLVRQWKKIHQDDTIEVEFDEVLLFQEVLERNMESTYGIKFSCTQFQSFNVLGCVSLHRHSQMTFNSTRIIHVVLKYLNYLAVQRLKVKVLGLTEENGSQNNSS